MDYMKVKVLNIVLYQKIKSYLKENLYELPDFDFVKNKDKIISNCTKIALISRGDIPGKTCLFKRFLGCEFPEQTLATIGSDKDDISYINKVFSHNVAVKFKDNAGSLGSIPFGKDNSGNDVVQRQITNLSIEFNFVFSEGVEITDIEYLPQFVGLSANIFLI